MVNIPFFGSDDEDDSKDDIEAENIRVTSNRSDPNVNIIDPNDDSTTSVGGIRVHTISLKDDKEQTGDTSDSSRSTGTETPTPQSPPQPSSPTTPSSGPSQKPDSPPISGPHSRGTLGVPADKDFLQKLEARGKNGHRQTVETVYVLTGPTYTRPTDLIRLDNDSYYGGATRSSVRFNPRAMAQKVADLYPSDSLPRLIARFHTHPSGSTTPSAADKQSAPNVRKAFVNAFGTDDFEFFHGIHGLRNHGSNPSPSERQRPSKQNRTISWKGEQYRHSLAVFGDRFEKQKDIAVLSQSDT